MNVYAKFRCAVLRIKKALGIFRELIPTTRKRRRTTTTRVAFGDPPSGSKNLCEPKDKHKQMLYCKFTDKSMS